MNSHLAELLKKGKIAVIPTDTIYGIVGSALNPDTVERIYKLRKRAYDKPFIILISSPDDLKKFGVQLTDNQRKFLENHWPNPLSVVLPVVDEKWKYLHRGTNSLAFRIPNNPDLLYLLNNVGPLVAPSANPEGEKYSETINEAKQYLGDNVDFYVDGGTLKSKPSTLLKLNDDGSYIILRQGNYGKIQS